MAARHAQTRTGSPSRTNTHVSRAPRHRVTGAAARGPGATAQHLQRTLGNQATHALLQRMGGPSAGPPEARIQAKVSDAAPPGGAAAQGWLLGSGRLRPKLEVGAVDDPLEREADVMADRVMRMKDGACCPGCAHGGSCAGSGDTVRRAPAAGAGGATTLPAGLEEDVEGLTTGGDVLPEAVRAKFEPRFGADFSGVRVHRDAAAAESSAALGAQAWTLGNHIAFGAGQWAPGTAAGGRLLAHELAHTVQQGATGTPSRDIGNVTRLHSSRIQRSWIGDRIDWVRTATQADNWASADPPGAYYVLNGLSMDDMVRVLRALTPVDRKKLSDNLDEHGAGFDRSRLQLGLANAATAPTDTAFRERSENLHWAIRSGNFAQPPAGAFYLLAAAKGAEQKRLIAALNRDALDALIDHRDEANGVPGGTEVLTALQRKRIDDLIRKQDWHGAAWSLARGDPAEITVQVRSMSSAHRRYLVEGARHGEGNWNTQVIISAVDEISHRDAIIGSVRFYVWKHLWDKAGTYLCGLNDDDIREVVIGLRLTRPDLNDLVKQQPDDTQAIRLTRLLLDPRGQVYSQAPPELVEGVSEKLAERWLLDDPLLGPYADKKFRSGWRITGHMHLVPDEKWTDTVIKYHRGRPDPETHHTLTEDELRNIAINMMGFTDPDTGEIYVRASEKYSVLIHEAIHNIESKNFKDQYGSKVSEGMTEYFARRVADRVGVRVAPGYPDEHAGVAALARLIGDPILAEGFFAGKVHVVRDAVDQAKKQGTFANWADTMQDDPKSAVEVLR